MKTCNTLINYLDTAHSTIHSEILLTNLSSIIYSSNLDYLSPNLTNDLNNLIVNWTANLEEDNFLIINKNFLKLSYNEKYSYKGQMIFPIVHNNKLDGLLIFFRFHQDFILSSSKYGKTVKHFIEVFSDDNFSENKIKI